MFNQRRTSHSDTPDHPEVVSRHLAVPQRRHGQHAVRSLLTQLLLVVMVVGLIGPVPGLHAAAAASGRDAPAPPAGEPQADGPAVTETPTPTTTATDVPPPATLEPTPSPTPPPTDTPPASREPDAGMQSSSFTTAATELLPVVLSLAPPSPVLVETTVTGQASWSDAPVGQPTGTVQYLVFTGSGCASTQFADGGTKTVDPGPDPFGSVSASDPIAFPAAGAYSWQAAYSGDVNYLPATVCADLTVTMTNPSLGLTTSPAGSISVGGTATGTATLTGATTAAGGSVTYTVYAENTCTTQVVPNMQSTKTVTGSVVPISDSFTFDETGTFYWQAVYSGDAANEGENSLCVSLTVTAGSLTASIASVELTTVTYSVVDRDNTGVLVLTVTDQRGTAEGWSVSLTVSGFTYSGVSPVASDIPASSLSLTTANAPAVMRGQAIDATDGPLVPATGATGSLDETVVVLVAEPGAGAGEYSQTLDVTLVVPAQSQTGTYTAIIQIVTSAAP